ncbi:MAG TPA: glycosyltransferase family 2 protein [Bryobacteraceae bacterium]|nr:glycosyltransferase family 2 protein [Bryobacteraceae bacterium]
MPVLPQVVFWLSAAAPVYAYIGYPVVLVLLALVIRRRVHRAPFEPTISLLIPAYNEADVIEAKIRNCLELDYPADRLEIVIACDGSKDNTPEVARRRADGDRIRVLAFPVNRGKIATLNEGVRHCRGDIVVFSDATAFLYRDSVRRLVMNFADPQVGAVSGRYTVVKADDVGIGKSEDFYWKYETFLKKKESEIASTLGGHGHLHAIRRELYPFPPPGTINDDYVIPVSVLARQYRAVYEPAAVVYEEAHEMAGFGRRVRIMAGNFQQLREIKGILWPFRPLPVFFFLSHKGSRLLVPFAMLTALGANLFLLSSPLYLSLFWIQVVFYGMALLGTVWKLRPKTLLLPFYFCMINAATFFGAYHALTSRRRMAWK